MVIVVLAVPVLLLVALVKISGLKRRVQALEERLADRQAPQPSQEGAWRGWQAPPGGARPGTRDDEGLQATDAAPAPAPAFDTGIGTDGDADAGIDATPGPRSADEDADGASVPPPLPLFPPAQPTAPAAPSGPSLVERGVAAAKAWFTEGNVPVKVGMLVLLAGVAALLKYAGDQGWLTLPVPVRYAGIAAAALAGLVFGWRQRGQRRGFALALQGGSIGALLLVVFAAFKISGLLQAPMAFGLSVVLVAGLCVLAVRQDARTLAVLGLLAGFLAPVWLSDGHGNHVALFSYYAVFNAAVFAIAWVRAWRVLNLLGFVFTFGIGSAWGVLSYRPELFASTEPFLLLFFAFYLLIPVLYARRGDAPAAAVDGSLLFGTPLVAFVLQAGLLDGARMPLALNALGLAVVYAALAAWLVRGQRTRLLGQGHAVLAVGFATLAIPLALSARATASVFALEGAGLLWLGLRQRRALPQWAGVGLQLAAAVGVVIGAPAAAGDARSIANPTFMSTVLLAVAGLASAWTLRAHARQAPALAAYLWG